MELREQVKQIFEESIKHLEAVKELGEKMKQFHDDESIDLSSFENDEEIMKLADYVEELMNQIS